MNVIKYFFHPKNMDSLGLIFLFLIREYIKKNSLLNILIYFSGLSILNYLFFIYNYWIPLKIKNIPPKIEVNINNQPALKSQISVLWFNTYCLPIITSRLHIQSVVDYIHACIIKHPVNIIGLCEVWLLRDAKYLSKYMLEMLGSDWNVYISSKNRIVGDGIILFWNKNDIHIGTLFSTRYGFASGVDSLVSKGFVTALVTPYKKINGKNVLSQNQSRKIIFTHMQDFADSNSFKKTLAHRRQFKQLHDSLIYKYPSFIIGDLNFDFFQKDNIMFDKSDGICSNYKLVPTYQECVHGNYSFKNRITCRTHNIFHSFDYVLKEKSNSETTSRIQIIRDVGMSNPSDHEAILFTVF